ncbi:MAG: methylated-DNA--[protein]-cysteine S-methyltransferase [Vagococcus sp.]
MIYTHHHIYLALNADELGLTSVEFVESDAIDTTEHTDSEEHILRHAMEELDAYFNGQLTTFTVPVHLTQGTPFQQRVWTMLQQIPYGTTCSYKELAKSVNSPKAYRAVGQANRHNPIPIIVPCHRVIGADGKLTGYLGQNESGIQFKQFLLKLEQQKLT